MYIIEPVSLFIVCHRQRNEERVNCRSYVCRNFCFNNQIQTYIKVFCMRNTVCVSHWHCCMSVKLHNILFKLIFCISIAYKSCLNGIIDFP